MLLGLDTSSPAVTVAVANGERVLGERTAVDARRHGELLAPAIASVLADAGVDRSELIRIAVGVGQRKTPKAFVESCEKFVFLEVLSRDDGATEQARDDQRPPIQRVLTKALTKVDADDDDWTSLGAPGNHLNRTDPSFDSGSYGFGKQPVDRRRDLALLAPRSSLVVEASLKDHEVVPVDEVDEPVLVGDPS